MTGWRLEYPVLALAGFFLLIFIVFLRRRFDERVAAVGSSMAGGMDLPALLTFVGTLMALVALGNPQYGIENTQENRLGVSILNVIDTSQSMEALDFGLKKHSLTRMDGAKQVVAEFIKQRAHDLHGIVVFGEIVFTLVPLTSDQDLLQQSIHQVATKIAGQATAIGDALALGVKRLRDAPTASKIIILTSDGESNAGDLKPMEAARFAADQGVRVYTIGIGSGDIAPIRVDSLFGKRIQNVSLPMDEKTLKNIASETGGHYFNAKNIGELQNVFDEIDQLEKSTFEAKVSVTYQDHYDVFLHWALGFLISSMCWQLLFRPRFPWL